MKFLPTSLFEKEVNKFPPFIERGARGDFTEEALSILFQKIRNRIYEMSYLENNVSVSRVRNLLNFHGSSLPAEASAQAGAPSGHGALIRFE